MAHERYALAEPWVPMNVFDTAYVVCLVDKQTGVQRLALDAGDEVSTCEHGADSVVGVENFDVLNCSVIGDEVEVPRVGRGLGVAAGLLEGAVDENHTLCNVPNANPQALRICNG